MPHQLHCLVSIVIWLLPCLPSSNTLTHITQYNILEVYYAIAGDNPRNVPTEMTFHLQHCFEYLRLSIMCYGDGTWEGAETTFPEGFDSSDGWDAKHVCKDYGKIFDYLDENRANDRVWIGI